LIHRYFSQIQGCLVAIAKHLLWVAHFASFWQCQNQQKGGFGI
jgi:hypothetical protein